jgi:hypothetical protein
MYAAAAPTFPDFPTFPTARIRFYRPDGFWCNAYRRKGIGTALDLAF